MGVDREVAGNSTKGDRAMPAERTSEADIRRLLDTGADDEAVCDAYSRLLTSLNGPTATVHRMGAVGFICARRPHLAERVLEIPVDGYYSHGNSRPDGIVRNGVAKAEEGWVRGVAGPDGAQWLREELPKLEGLIGRLLWEVAILRELVTFEDHPPMTEADWPACDDATRMWRHVRRSGRPPYRKRVLLAAEVCRAAAGQFRNEEALCAVIRRFEARAEPDFAGDLPGELPDLNDGLTHGSLDISDEESRVIAPGLRDIFGNPFRPVAFSPEWRTSTVVALASQMYESRDFSAMPILADALQDAGCEDEQVLAHCCAEGPHVRGCFVVDQVLGKG